MPTKKAVKATKKKKKVRMLCVTDQSELKSLVKNQFGKFFDLTEVSSGEEGVDVAIEKKPHIVLMDFNLHTLSGVDAARMIKQKLPRTKVVMLTMYQCDSCPTGL